MAEKRHLSSILKQLNPQQLQAVTTIEGPVMVIAGPGTGKTQVLAARIATILEQTDTNPSSILALTFTDSAAQNMRERLVRMIGKTGYYVQIHTFHSFCTEVIASHPEFFPIDRESQPLSELERFQLFENLINTLPLKTLKPLNAPYLYLRDMIKAISDLKREGINLEKFRDLIAVDESELQTRQKITKTEQLKIEKNLAKNHELVQIYEAYQQNLRATQRFDFDDMISLVLSALREEDELLLEYQEKIHYFLIDEYQDTNTAQNQIVDLLASYWQDQANVFVVGDPNQAIYRFQGASLENVMSFAERYPSTQIITLTHGYRAPQELYDAAAALIAENHQEESLKVAPPAWLEQLSQPLQSLRSEPSSLEVLAAPSQTVESVMIAEMVQELLHQGVPPEEIAILYRNNSDSDDIVTTLDKWQIDYDIDGGSDILQADHICQLLNLLRVIVKIRSGKDCHELYEVLQYPWWGVDPLLVMKAARAASKAKLSLLDLIEQGYDTFSKYYPLFDVTALEFSVLSTLVANLHTWGARDASTPLNTWLEQVLQESGYMPWLLEQPTKVEMVHAVNALFREAQKLMTQSRSLHVADFLIMIDTLQKFHLQLTLEDLNISTGAVHVSTVHKAKGREWDYVFLVKCLDGKWGNTRQHNLIPLPSGVLTQTDISALEQNADDRRLLYVALTRAKKKCLISYPETVIQDNRTKIGTKSLFLTELESHLQPVSSAVVPKVLAQPDDLVVKLLQPSQPHDTTELERAYFAELVKDLPLSVSALNTYLQSPRDFVNQYLLKVPTAQTPQLAFGTAVHLALEKLFKAYLQGERLDQTAFLKVFEERLLQEPLEEADFKARLQRGREILPSYYEYASQGGKPLAVERFFGRGANRAMLDDISLTGRIDRVDWLDQRAKEVLVIDYKTGKPRTLGEIEGKTQSANLSEREQALPEGIRGRYKRQLVFYALLSELDPSFPVRVTHGEFHFVEPDSSGKLIIRRVRIQKEDLTALKTLIREVMGEIRALAFLTSN